MDTEKICTKGDDSVGFVQKENYFQGSCNMLDKLLPVTSCRKNLICLRPTTRTMPGKEKKQYPSPNKINWCRSMGKL